MKLSVSTSVYYRYGLVESIKRIAELGCNAVEVWVVDLMRTLMI